MSKTERHYVNKILKVQRSTIELVIVAVVLALGINLASNAVPQLLNLSNVQNLSLGIGLCALSVIYAARRLSSSLSMSLKLEGVLLLGEHNEVVKIRRYRFSESTASNLEGLCAENKALEASWKKGNLGFLGRDSAGKTRHSQTAHQLASEAIEYFVLDELSLHLSEYFDSNRDVPEDSIARFQRRDIPQILLDNHFLEQFSKPMSEREAFQDHQEEDFKNVVSAWGADGEIFDHFELILPKGSTLSRDNGSLKIKTSRYTLAIEPQYRGFNINLPSDFEELYFGVPFNTYSPHLVNLELSVNFHWWSLLTPGGWDHYQWLDSFIEKLDRAFSFELFIDDVGWQTAHSVAIAVRSANEARAKRS